MSTLLIASSEKDYKYLQENGFIPSIQKAFKADEHIWCDTIECIKELSQTVDYILHFNSFPLSYAKIRSYAAASMTVDNIIGVQINPEEVWIYDNGSITGRTTHKDLIASLINAVNKSNRTNRVGNILLALIFAAIIIAMLLTNFKQDKCDTNTSTTTISTSSQIEAIE